MMFGGGRHLRSAAREGAKPTDTGKTLRRLLVYFRPYWGLLAVAGLLTVVSSLLRLLGPYLTGVAVAQFIDPGGQPRPPWLDWVLAASGPTLAWLVSRAAPVGVWATRVGLPITALGAGVGAGLPAGVAPAAAGVLLAGLAWTRPVSRSVWPLTSEPVPAVPIPPELVAPEILRSAGYDDRGRPRSGEAE